MHGNSFLSGIAVAPRYARQQFSKVSLLLHVIVLPAVVTLRQKHRSIPQYDSEGCCAVCNLVQCALGWSDFHFFAIFENGHIAIDWAYFYEFSSKKSANFVACARGARAQIFSFSKNHRDLENENCFESWHELSFYIKDQLPKIEFKIRDCLAFFLFFKNGFNLKNILKNIFSSVSSFLAFK